MGGKEQRVAEPIGQEPRPWQGQQPPRTALDDDEVATACRREEKVEERGIFMEKGSGLARGLVGYRRFHVWLERILAGEGERNTL